MSDYSDYYVYLHVRDSDGVVFYVGKGRKHRGVRSRKYRNWLDSKGDSSFTSIVFADSLSNKQALEYEKILILNPLNGWKLCNKKHSSSIHNQLDGVELGEHFYYCPTSPTGLRWNRDNGARNPKTKRQKGDPAGTPHYDSRRGNTLDSYTVRLFGAHLTTHRIVWVLNGGTLDENMVIDHIDGNVSNNCIENLRQISPLDNSLNRKLGVNSTTGINGVQRGENVNSAYYTASYKNSNGDGRLKYFSVLKYGEEQAKQLAIEFRQEYEKTRNFSERHGK